MNPSQQHNHLPRLAREFYHGQTIVHWTLAIPDRATGWLHESFHHQFREVTLHTATREHLICPAYCLMPDHLHVVWIGLTHDSDQLTGMTFFRSHLEPALNPHRFQHQAYDHVLRDDERMPDAFAIICDYIFANPVRKNLVERPEEWKFSGVIVPGYPRLNPFEAGHWETFWRIHAKLVEA